MGPDPELIEILKRHQQDHLLRWWPSLSDSQHASLLDEIRGIDFEQIEQLIALHLRTASTESHDLSRILPVDFVHEAAEHVQHSAGDPYDVGMRALAGGEVAVVLVAGGQGTRLGFDGPKGTYPVGPVSQASLFEVHAAKVAALSDRANATLRFYVMTSEENDRATREFFESHDRFGLRHVRFFKQGRLPAVDRENGRILLAEKHRIALSPSGHGGVLSALAQAGPGSAPSCLAEMRAAGVRTIFYFQVDNPLVKVADPEFVGLHRLAGADVSFKVVEKTDPLEKIGVVVQDGPVRRVIEYSNLPSEMAVLRDAGGHLRFRAGSIAVHIFEVEFLDRLLKSGLPLPYHKALKAVPFIDDRGSLVKPKEPNAIKFESFIFDVLPQATKSLIVETDREVEFAPLKNATGVDSPEFVRHRMTDLFASWLEMAGWTIARGQDGTVPFPIEIDARYAYDSTELVEREAKPRHVNGPLLLK